MPDEPKPTRLEAIAALFARQGVEFLVIGGQAEYLFGSPRVTYDVDLCYRRSAENLERLARALQALRPRSGARRLTCRSSSTRGRWRSGATSPSTLNSGRWTCSPGSSRSATTKP
jgi:hypothetical protein